MRTRWSRRECRVEVHVKARIQLQVIFEYLDHVNMMVAFKVDLSEVVLIEKVVGDDQSLVVVGEHDHVRAGVHAQVDDSCLERMLRVAYIKHPHLPGLERSEEQTVTALRHVQQLGHASADWHCNMRNDGLAVEYDFSCAGFGVYQIHQAVEHASRERARLRITGNQCDGHGDER